MSQIEQMPFLDHKRSSLIRNKTHSTIMCPLIHLLILPLDFTSSIGFGHSMVPETALMINLWLCLTMM